MFEPRGWSREGRFHGPVPTIPGCADASELLKWAARAPLNGAWLDAITGIDPELLRGDERMGLVLAWERVRRGADSGFTAALGAIMARPCRPDPGDPSCDGGVSCSHDWSREEAQTALVLGPQHAAHLLDECRELTARLPGMLAEVASGAASMLHARKLASHTVGLSDAMAETVAAGLAGRAGSITAGAFNRLVLAAVARLRTAEETLAAHEKSSRRRTGNTPLPPQEDGLGGAVLIGPAERIAEIFGWARTFTRTNGDPGDPGDPRTVGQRRFDAIVDAILGADDLSFGDLTRDPGAANPSTPDPAAPHPVTPTSPRRRRHDARVARDAGREEAAEAAETTVRQPRVALKLVLSAETLAGLNNDPGWLEGYGNLPAMLARPVIGGKRASSAGSARRIPATHGAYRSPRFPDGTGASVGGGAPSVDGGVASAEACSAPWAVSSMASGMGSGVSVKRAQHGKPRAVSK